MVSGDNTDARDAVAEDRGDEDPVYEAAAGWVARLASRDATERDREAFEVWRGADPAHAAAYAEMDALWHTLGRVPDRRPRRAVSKAGLAGLAVALVLCAALAVQLGLVDRLRSDLWSGIGDITHATLADGSRIDLNSGTAVALHFSETERGVTLLRGEAFFDVVPDPRRPFVVRGGGLSARAVGTRFFVSADGADRPVGVVEGSVDVAASGPPVRIVAGEAVRRAEDAPLSVLRADIDRATAWRTGRLVFSGERLSTVLMELGRYRHGRIVLLDAAAGERRVTGAFDPRDTDEALDAIASSLGVRVTRLSPLLVLVGSPFRKS